MTIEPVYFFASGIEVWVIPDQEVVVMRYTDGVWTSGIKPVDPLVAKELELAREMMS